MNLDTLHLQKLIESRNGSLRSFLQFSVVSRYAIIFEINPESIKDLLLHFFISNHERIKSEKTHIFF